MKAETFTNITYESRAKERHRRLLLTTFASVGGWLVSLLTVLISVPMTANYLGSERYGLWAAIGAFVALLSFADLGIGSGLLNAITECHGRDDLDRARQYVSSVLAMLSAVAALWVCPSFLCTHGFLETVSSMSRIDSPLRKRGRQLLCSSFASS